MKCSPSLVCFVLLVLFVCPASLRSTWSRLNSYFRGRGYHALKIEDPEGKGKWEGQTKTDEALKDICVSEVHRLPAHATIFLQTLLLDSRIADKLYHSSDPPAPDAATIDLIVQFLSPVCPAHKNVFTSKAFMSLAKGAVNRFSENGLDSPWPLKADPDELTVPDTQKWIVCDLLSLKINKEHKVPYEQLVKMIGNMFFRYSESKTLNKGEKLEDSDVVHQNKVKAWVIAVVMCRDNSMDLPPKSWFNSGSDGTGNFLWPPNGPCIAVGVVVGLLVLGYVAYTNNWFGQNPTPPPPDPTSPPSTTTIQVPTSLLSTTNIILTILFIMAISGGIYWWYYLRMSHSQIEESSSNSSSNSSSATKKTKTRGHKKKNKKRTSSYFASVVSSFYEPKRKNKKHKAKAKKKKQDSNFGSDISGMGSSSCIPSSSVQSSAASSFASNFASSAASSPKPKKKSPKVSPKQKPKNLKRKIIDSALDHGNRKKMNKK